MLRPRLEIRGWRAVVLICAGIYIGTVLITPAQAHFMSSIRHIIEHAKKTFYTKSQADARYVRGNGPMLVTAGHGQWQIYNTTEPVELIREADRTYVQRTTTGFSYISLHPAMPISLYGKRLKATGVEMCYDATDPGASLAAVKVGVSNHTDGLATAAFVVFEPIVRDDAACRLYTFVSPVVLDSNTVLSVLVLGNWTTADAPLEIGRTTFVLEPTTQAVTPVE